LGALTRKNICSHNSLGHINVYNYLCSPGYSERSYIFAKIVILDDKSCVFIFLDIDTIFARALR